KKLKKVGFSEEQAEALAETQAQLIEERLATKRDLEAVKHDLRRDLKEMEMRILTRIGGMFAASIAILGVLIKIL
ncbi:DUF1640 domain-containing protein, partial [Magnetococcales bacterium HHB-1]